MKEIQQKTQSTVDNTQKDNIHQSKRTFFVNITINITYLIAKIVLLAILILMLNSINLSSFTKTNSYLRVQENLWLWQKQIIIDLRIVDSQICPVEFQDFATFQWPGNIQGCYCQIKIGLYQYISILQGQCGQLQFENGCYSIDSHQKMEFSYWIYGAHLCVKRLKNYNFYSTSESIINPNGYPAKYCSSETEFQIDLIQPIQCPITHLQNSKLLPNVLEQLGFSYQRQQNYPLVYFRIAQDEFCQQLYNDNVSPGRKSNYILQKKAKFQCKKKDQRTVFIQEQSQAQLFQNNPNIKEIVESLPGYPAIDEHFRYKLGFIRYPQWKYTCRSSQQFSLLNSKTKMTLENITPTITTCTYIIILCIIIAYVLIFLYFLDHYLHLKAKKINGYLYLKDYEIKKLTNQTNLVRNRYNQILKFIFCQFFIIISLITLIVFYTKIINQRSWYEQSLLCTSEPFISYLNDFLNFYSSTLIYLITSIFINVSILIIDLCHIIYRLWKGDLQQETQIEQTNEKQDIIQSTLNNDINIIKNFHMTQQNLIQNSFFVKQTHTDLQIQQINYQDDQDFQLSSEYSQSQPS